MFPSVTGGSSGAWTVEPVIEVFCSQTRGFIYRRVVGLVAINFTIRKHGAIVEKRTFERAVTDADPEYSGSSVTSVEQAMRRCMADSLRLVLGDALKEIERTIRLDISGYPGSDQDFSQKQRPK
jgi:hypothetical protein